MNREFGNDAAAQRDAPDAARRPASVPGRQGSPSFRLVLAVDVGEAVLRNDSPADG